MPPFLRKLWLNLMYRLRRQIFRQIVQKACRNPVGFQVPFVQYDGKYASKMCIKAYAVIYSEVPLCLQKIIVKFAHMWYDMAEKGSG